MNQSWELELEMDLILNATLADWAAVKKGKRKLGVACGLEAVSSRMHFTLVSNDSCVT